jgi:hypothetical protein
MVPMCAIIVRKSQMINRSKDVGNVIEHGTARLNVRNQTGRMDIKKCVE